MLDKDPKKRIDLLEVMGGEYWQMET